MIPKLNIDFPISKMVQAFVPWLKSREYPYHNGSTYYLNHARTGLRIALTALNLPSGSKVGMSMYNCLTVMNAVRVAGYEIVFIDITDDLVLDLDDLKKKKAQLAALIITHFYGIPNNIDAIKEIIPGIPLIEDCAHAYGSLFNDGTSVGSKGNFAVFSTGLGKFPSIGNGGLLLVNDSTYLQQVDKMVSLLPRPDFMAETKMIIKSFAKYIAYRPFIYQMLLPLKKCRQQKNGFNEMYQHREMIMPKYVHYLFCKSSLQINEHMQKQQYISYKLSDCLSNIPGVLMPDIVNGKRNGFLFPIIVGDKTVVTKKSFLSQFELTSHFGKSVIWAKEYGYMGGCPNGERISENIIVLPCSYNIKKLDLKEINL